MSVKCFKLANGEEILSTVTNETSELAVLKQPHIIFVAGEGQLGMVPWLPLAEWQCRFSHREL